MTNQSQTLIRVLKTEERVHSKCFICEHKDHHKYWDPESNAHICRHCIAFVLNAEYALAETQGISRPPIQTKE